VPFGTDAFLALHDGHIVAEQYFGEMTPLTRHRVFSMAKGFTATAGAQMLEEKLVDEVALASRYVPELAQTAYDGATVRQLLDMQVSIRYDYFCPKDDANKGNEKAWEMGTDEFRHADHPQARYQRICGMVRKLEGEAYLGAYDVLFDLKDRLRPHGTVFNYACPTSLAFQLILERVSGRSMIELLSTQLWQRLGVERPATMQIDDLGTALAHGGLAVTARDLARWGQLLLDDGRVGSEQVVPSKFLEDIQRNSNRDKFNKESNLWGFYAPGCGYRSYFLIAPEEPSQRTRFWSGGGWGQWCFIDPARRNVIVKFSTELDVDIANARDYSAICSFSELLPEIVG
jgi:CubicO group peptidase (beta-lactamase class C family)